MCRNRSFRVMGRMTDVMRSHGKEWRLVDLKASVDKWRTERSNERTLVTGWENGEEAVTQMQCTWLCAADMTATALLQCLIFGPLRGKFSQEHASMEH
jgi:hypothetical protein